MGLLDSLFGVLKRLFYGTEEQDSKPPQSYQHQQRQWEQRPYPTPYQPPARPQQAPLRTQRVSHNPVDQENDSQRSLRDRATEEGDAMAKSFQGSHEAHANRDRALAKKLSDKAKQHRAEMNRLNKEASEHIFTENNKHRQPGEVDLHGLYVQEAIAFTKQFIQEARSRGDTQISVIVGKGLHSRAGAKIKPAIEGLMQKQHLVTREDPSNAGVLIVSLDGQAHGAGRAVRSRKSARGISR